MTEEIKSTMGETTELTMSEVKKQLEESDTFRDLPLLDESKRFNELLADKDIARVEVYSLFMYDIFGVPMEKPFICFSGIFKWKNNEIISLDDDSYNKELTVYGYEWGHKNAVLLILAGNDWCK